MGADFLTEVATRIEGKKRQITTVHTFSQLCGIDTGNGQLLGCNSTRLARIGQDGYGMDGYAPLARFPIAE